MGFGCIHTGLLAVTTSGAPLVVEKQCSVTAKTQVALIVIAGIILLTHLNTTLVVGILYPDCKIL